MSRHGHLDPVDAGLLDPVLELAVIVAQAGLRTVPPLEPPSALKPFLRFTHKVPGPALRVARTVLDADADYRARVAIVATEELVGEAGMVFLLRSDGWEARLAELRQAEPTAHDARPTKHDRQADRKLAGAEAALLRSEEAFARAKAELTVTQAALSEERKARNRLSAEAERVGAALRAVEAVTVRLQADLDAAQRSAREAAQMVESLRTELQAVTGELDRRVTLETALGDATTAVERVGAAMRELRSTEGAVIRSRGATPPRAARLARPSARRSPVVLPGAMFDDSSEAAGFLLRTDGVTILVDGYNVAKWKWADATPRELRQRLLAMVSQVVHRTGAQAHIVFDGAFADGVSTVAGGSARVRVSFTTVDVEADDMLLDLAAAAPPGQPVVVVSSDRRVRDGAVALGVNAVPTPAFVAACASAG